MTKQAELKKQAYESSLKSRALSILIYLIDRSNKELTCFPAIPTIAEQLHISVSTVKRALRELEDSGYIIREFRFRENNKGQTSNLYTLVLFECQLISDESDNLEPNEYEEDVESMEVENVEVAQRNEVSQEKCQVEHISFDIIKAQKAETRECYVKELLYKSDDSDCRKEAIESQRRRVACAFDQNITSLISDQDTGQFSLIENKTKVTHLYLWTGVGVSWEPP